MDEVEVRRFAIKYEPPTLVVEYRTSKGLFLKKLRIKTHGSNVVTYVYLILQNIKFNKHLCFW